MTDMALVKLNQAELMLSEARTIQDVKQVLDVVEAVRIYAKRAKLGTRTINSAVQFKIEAERRLGDMLKQMPKNEGTRGQLKGDVPVGTSITAGPTDNTPTLAEIGITYKQSTRAQHLADLSPEVVAAHCNEQNERGEEITVTGLLRAAKTEHNKQQREQEQIAAAAIELPKDVYRCLVIDPPWEIKKIAREVRPNQAVMDYPMMSEQQLQQLPIADFIAPGCHLYLWVTHKYLPAGLRIAEAWGFRYQCLLTWVKNVGFTPFSWMYSTEHVLFCRRGSLDLLQLGRRLDFNAPVREHSRKPEQFFQLVRDVSPGPRLEMFAREQHEGFESWGNEVNRFQTVETGST